MVSGLIVPLGPVQTLPETDSDADQFLTIDALTEERRKRKAEAETLVAKQAQSTPPPQEGEPVSDVEGLEEEADQQGAFNPETGEINWDCPCLGGMANGPCGEEFKAAFSCFVHSTEEPKGMDCVDKFKYEFGMGRLGSLANNIFRNMQNCFREYPEVYGSELETEDEDDMTSEDQEQLDAPITASDRPSESSQQSHDREARQQRAKEATEQVRQDHGDAEKQYVGPASSDKSLKSDSGNEGKKQRAKAAAQQVKKEHEPLSESDEVVPKAWHDETAANAKKQ